ncbi:MULTISPECIES: GntR family transcriptional regulator [Cohnella]|uniref:GntR family transcriptional regulator n=1 Tax=Cohnella TaxID=329857 RepID=UPI0009B99D6C|nr:MULTISPECIES: GntR family transcriptional regulator [Cohnella]MBN2980441.1 GntR family transcriptional regulator [Cohnella algarum]
MLDDKLPVTLQYQLRSALLEKIERRVWSPGAQIPSERELCEEYGVSRITVREVLKELVQKGYLVRKQGKGTFVSVPRFVNEFTSSYSLSEEIEKEGLTSDFKILSFKTCSPSPELQKLLGLAPSEPVWELTRLRLIGNEPFAWERAYTPWSVMEGAGEEQLEKEGLYLTIFRCSGLMAEEAEVESEAVNCPAELVPLLQLKKNAAVMHLTRVTKAQQRNIEYCESYVRSDRYKYRYRQILRKKNR